MNLEQERENYIKNKTGSIYQVLADYKKPGKVLLRSKNRYISKYLMDIKQGVVTGEWSSVNVGELKKWIEKDNKYMEALTQKLLKRVILSQLLLELDDELMQDYKDNSNFKNHINKSNKAAERLFSKQYDELYKVDKTTLQNFMGQVDELTSLTSSFELTDFLYLNIIVKDYKNNPQKYQEAKIQFTKIDA